MSQTQRLNFFSCSIRNIISCSSKFSAISSIYFMREKNFSSLKREGKMYCGEFWAPGCKYLTSFGSNSFFFFFAVHLFIFRRRGRLLPLVLFYHTFFFLIYICHIFNVFFSFTSLFLFFSSLFMCIVCFPFFLFLLLVFFFSGGGVNTYHFFSSFLYACLLTFLVFHFPFLWDPICRFFISCSLFFFLWSFAFFLFGFFISFLFLFFF